MLPQVDAIEYYSAKEKDLLGQMREQAELAPTHPLGMAFVTLQTEAMAKLCVAILFVHKSVFTGGRNSSNICRI